MTCLWNSIWSFLIIVLCFFKFIDLLQCIPAVTYMQWFSDNVFFTSRHSIWLFKYFLYLSSHLCSYSLQILEHIYTSCLYLFLSLCQIWCLKQHSFISSSIDIQKYEDECSAGLFPEALTYLKSKCQQGWSVTWRLWGRNPFPGLLRLLTEFSSLQVESWCPCLLIGNCPGDRQLLRPLSSLYVASSLSATENLHHIESLSLRLSLCDLIFYN